MINVFSQLVVQAYSLVNCHLRMCSYRSAESRYHYHCSPVNTLVVVLGVVIVTEVPLLRAQVYPVQDKSVIKYEALQYFDIDPGSMSSILNHFAIKTDCEIFYSAEIVQNVQSNGVRGTYSNQEALEKILEGTGLKFERTDERIYLIHMVFANSASESADLLNNTEIADVENIIPALEMEELIITASKRNQSIQELAMSVSALSYTDLNKRALVSMEDYLSSIPGVNQVDRGVGRNSVVIRGVSADPAFEEATVGVYFDEVPLTGRAYFGSADLKLVDMERVEVLRGPQGTLYGAGSLAGTVRNIPVEPNLSEVEGKVTVGSSEMAGEGSDGNKAIGTINIPLIANELAIRASLYRFENSGYIKNIAGSHAAKSAVAQQYGITALAVNEDDIGRSEYKGSRVRVLWEPTDQFSFTLNYLSQDLEQDGLPDAEFAVGAFRQTRFQLAAPIGGGEKLVDDIDLGNVVIKYNWSWGEMLSSTSLYDEFALRNTELTRFIDVPIFQTPSRDTTAFVEEIRFKSEFQGPMQVLAGIYYENNERVDKSFSVQVPEVVTDPPGDLVVFVDYVEDTDLRQTALFGDITYEFSEHYTLKVGGRYFDYNRDNRRLSSGKFIEDSSTPKFSRNTINETGVNTNVNFSFTPNEEVLIYSQYSEGFRLGIPQLLVPTDACDTNSDGKLDGTEVPINTPGTESDNLKSMEVGAKYTTTDNRFFVGGTFFHNDWSGIPVRIRGTCGSVIAVNAGEAETQGIDVESNLYITPSLRLYAGASYIDAELQNDVEQLRAVKGSRLAGSARYTFNLAFQYDTDFVGNSSFIRIDYSKSGGYYSNVQETGPELGNYNLFNIKAGVTYNDISLEMYINNVTNTDRLVWAEDSGNVYLHYPLRPRVFGVDLSYSF